MKLTGLCANGLTTRGLDMHEGDCQKCKDWHGCVGKAWYDYGEIRWCPFQVMWILQHSNLFDAGKWPPQDNRVESIETRQICTEADFVHTQIILGELNYRLKRTGTPGKLLKAQARAGDSLDYLEAEAWDALMYVKGWRRKSQSFSNWKKDKRYHQKPTQK